MMNVLAAISLAAPAMLAGVVLVSLPVIAHLLNRRARREVVFPSLMLLSASAASQHQMLRLRRWLLLALRALAVLAIVAAFAWPLWTHQAATAASEDSRVAVVLVVDVSASSAQQHDGVSAITALQGAAGRAIDDLLRGADTANLVLADAQPTTALPTMSGNLAALREEVARIAPTHERANLPAALGVAAEMLGGHDGPRHLVVLSDLQQSNWQDVLAGAAPSLPPHTRVTIVPPDAPAPGNLAVQAVATDPVQPRVGQDVQVRVRLANHADQRQAATATLLVEGQRHDTKSVSIGPRQHHELAFTVSFQTPGAHRLRVTLPEDALPGDNVAWQVVQVHEQTPVALISDGDSDQPGTAAYFLTRALAPHGDGRDRYSVVQVSPERTADYDLTAMSVIVLGDAAELPEAGVRQLASYLEAGGGVLAFAATPGGDRNLAALDRALGGQASPAAVAGLLQVGGPQRNAYLQTGAFSHPLLASFDPRSQEALQRIPFTVRRELGPLREGAVPLLQFEDRVVAAAVRPVGAGHLVLANFSPALDSSGLGKHGGFVALVHSLVEGLAPDTRLAREPVVGELFTATTHSEVDRSAAAPVLVGPSDRPVMDVQFEVLARSLRVTTQQTTEPGLYRIVQAGRELGLVAVNVDRRESDLRRVDAAAVQEALGGASAVAVRSVADEAMLDVRGRPLWGWLLVAAAMALTAEMLLLGWWRR